jgi:hypothetical protein
MVGVAQSVELLVVVQAVGGSSPLAHPLRIPRYGGGFLGGERDALAAADLPEQDAHANS